MAVIFCNSQLIELFEHVGAAFLEFAERAQTNTMQSAFFEAMGLIQRRRSDMEQAFRQYIERGFADFRALGSAKPGKDQEGTPDKELELSILGQEEMEESVAAEKVIANAYESFFGELYALSQRLAVVNNGVKLKNVDIPAGPDHLVHAFRRSMEGLHIEVKIKIVLYALFDKFVVKEAKGLYNELNGNLKEAGILPDLKPLAITPERARKARGQSPAREESEAAEQTPPLEQAPGSLGDQLFESIVDLMSKQQRGRERQGARRSTPMTPAEQAEAAAASLEVVAAASRIQSNTNVVSAQEILAELAQVPDLEVDAKFVDKVRETLSQERKQVLAQVDQEKLSPIDLDLIDLIGMLFEYMLNDPVLPNLAKALLSHLHTPYLKVALIDRRLLVDARHPARRLLDQMVEAGSLWVDENSPQQGIYPDMQRIVDRVLKEFVDDVGLFDQLLASFEKSMAEQQKKTDTMEQRIQDAARGRERLQLAKRRAKKEIENLIGQHPLPDPVANFLTKTWLDQLVFVLMQDDEEARPEAWMRGVQTAEDLVGLFDPNPQPEVASPRQIAARTAELRDQIVRGLREMGSAMPSTLDSLFELLDAPERWPESCAQAAAARPRTAAADKAQKKSQDSQDSQDSQEASSDQEREVINRLRKMKPGTWFEFASATGGVKRRIKLSWLSPLTATCMFVDRSGMQAEIKTLRELANEIVTGRAKVIPRPRHPFIERALVSIRNMLQTDVEITTDTTRSGS